MDLDAYPGGDLVEKGLRDVARGIESDEALLVSIGARRLTRAGLEVKTPFDDPEHALYLKLASREGNAAHSRYNALIRKLVSFERAFECAR